MNFWWGKSFLTAYMMIDELYTYHLLRKVSRTRREYANKKRLEQKIKKRKQTFIL